MFDSSFLKPKLFDELYYLKKKVMKMVWQKITLLRIDCSIMQTLIYFSSCTFIEVKYMKMLKSLKYPLVSK